MYYFAVRLINKHSGLIMKEWWIVKSDNTRLSFADIVHIENNLPDYCFVNSFYIGKFESDDDLNDKLLNHLNSMEFIIF